ncbi:MAG: cytidylate kinase-like family protein [Lachnospiraceae bacterium]|jgi:cytidylate kinase|nr:cytidylate kinase-like family protein [Lachnospiraceae bacterium]
MAEKTNTIITIGREFGSGGIYVAKEISKILNIPLYDKEMLEEAAKESGIAQNLFENNDEKPTSSFLYSLVMDTYSFGFSSGGLSDMPLNHKIFLAQFEAIKKIAAKGPCVLVGRCADYALADNKNMISVFIHADLDFKVNQIVKREKVTASKAKELILKTDKQRASYYNYYTNKKWGDSDSYDLCINSSKFGIEKTVDLILKAVEIKDNL